MYTIYTCPLAALGKKTSTKHNSTSVAASPEVPPALSSPPAPHPTNGASKPQRFFWSLGIGLALVGSFFFGVQGLWVVSLFAKKCEVTISGKGLIFVSGGKHTVITPKVERLSTDRVGIYYSRGCSI